MNKDRGGRHYQLKYFNKTSGYGKKHMQVLELINGSGRDPVRVFTERNTEKRRDGVHYKLRCINMVTEKSSYRTKKKKRRKLYENLYLKD